MTETPYTFDLNAPDFVPGRYDNHIRRTLTSMRGQYRDTAAYDALLAVEDTLLYEVYELQRPHVAGELLHGISIVHPGQVGDEYFMTKGHFHTVLETAEVYHCLKGEGVMVMAVSYTHLDVYKRQARLPSTCACRRRPWAAVT